MKKMLQKQTDDGRENYFKKLHQLGTNYTSCPDAEKNGHIYQEPRNLPLYSVQCTQTFTRNTLI